MAKMTNVLCYAAIAAVLLAGSCAALINDGGGLRDDGAANHPITVEPRYVAIELPFSAAAAGLLPYDEARFSAFVADYLERGNGAISISAPAGGESAAAISYFGERLAALGVPRARILVGTHPADGDKRVKLGYIGFAAHSDPCGDWSESLAATADNRTNPNFGCAVQHNIAAQVSDPRDLIAPRALSESDATRRNQVLGKYEKGQATAAEKTSAQSGKVSDVSNQ